MTELRGTWFVVPTPFHEDGSLDLESQARLADAAIGWGVDGLTAMGVTSEVAELSSEERGSALGAITEAVGGRVPLVVGCSASASEAVVTLTRRAGEVGAAAAMVAAPPGGGADDLPVFFERVAAEADLPIVVQDEPAATAVVFPVETLVRCVQTSGSSTLKLEDPPTPPKIAALLELVGELSVFGGLGGAFALAELRHGAAGTMTGFAFPEILRAVREAVESGEDREAARVFDRYLPLLQFEAQPGVGLAVRKEVLRRRGAIRSSVVRRGAPLDPITASELDDVLSRTGVSPSPERLHVEPSFDAAEEAPHA